MDTLNHGVQSFLITAIPVTLITSGTAGLVAGAVFGVIGMLPDIIGEYFAHYREKDGFKYKKYAELHSLNFLNLPEKIILFSWYLHIVQDSFLHITGRRWWVLNERGYYEILMWFINLILLIILIIIL